MSSEFEISFQPLSETHFAMLHRWLNEPHIKEWWGEEGCTFSQVQDKYMPRITKREPGSCYIFAAGAEPIGYIQNYWLQDYPEYSSQLGIVVGAKTAAFDVFIGERNWLGRGVGALVMRQFLCEFIFGEMQAENCIVGPDETNSAAIKAYSKVGFKHVNTVRVAGEPRPEYLMEIRVVDIADSHRKGSH